MNPTKPKKTPRPQKRRLPRGAVEATNMASTPQTLANGVLPSDVLGSYTGVSSDGDVPEQDADDL